MGHLLDAGTVKQLAFLLANVTEKSGPRTKCMALYVGIKK